MTTKFDDMYTITMQSVFKMGYSMLYHDCSDLSHVLVFTITWQEKKPGDIMV